MKPTFLPSLCRPFILITASLLSVAWATPAGSNPAQGLSTRLYAPMPSAAALVELDRAIAASPTTQRTIYTVTLRLPARSQQRFAKISLTDKNLDQGLPPMQFDLNQTQLFLGAPGQGGNTVQVTGAWVDETGTIWVEFNPALPGQTNLTLLLHGSTASPTARHDYGIAAYPEVPRPVAIFVEDVTLQPANF
jgi:hypothetical protein